MYSLLLATVSALSIHSAHAESVAPSQDYVRHCASCHGATLGGGFGPALRGSAFDAKWRGRERELTTYVRTTMPPQAPGSLQNASYAALSTELLSGSSADSKSTAQTAAPTAVKYTPSAGAVEIDDVYREQRESLAKLASRLTPVGDEMLFAPPTADWLAWRGNAHSSGHSALKQIDTHNVDRLAPAWSLSLTPGTNAIAPLVHDGVLFINSSGTISALDARNGDLIWQFSRPIVATHGVPITQPRAIALYQDKLIVPTLDNHMLALDMRTGQLLWDHEIAGPSEKLQITGGPLLAKGKIIQGVSGCQGTTYPGGCFIVALDATDGRELWRFHTIARPGQPGGDSWNGAPVAERFGASVWTAGSYDPELNLVYFGTGQTYKVATLLGSNTGKSSRDALYTNSTVALDPDTARLAWHFQHFPADVWDLDWSFERIVTSLTTATGPRKVVITAGKLGIVDVLDARDGSFIASWDAGLQNLVQRIDPKTGRKHANPALALALGETKLVCPHASGARNWPATAYDAEQRLLYLPMFEVCMDIRLEDTYYGDTVMLPRRRAGSDGKFGRVLALDPSTGKTAWTVRRRAVASSAILATAGGLIFEGSNDRALHALDSKTGALLWQTRLPGNPNGFPLSYAVAGKQYVAIVAGGGSPLELSLRGLTPELPSSVPSKTLEVFALPDALISGAQQPAAPQATQ